MFNTVHQIASFKPTFSKRLRLSRGHIPLRHPPASRKRDGRHWRAIFYFQKSGHFTLKIVPPPMVPIMISKDTLMMSFFLYSSFLPYLFLTSSLSIPASIHYHRLSYFAYSFIRAISSRCLSYHSPLSLPFDYVTSFLFLISSFFVVWSWSAV